MPQNHKVNFYLVSDSTGETVLSISSAVLAQFENVQVNKFMWPMVRSELQVDKLISYLEQIPGVVLYTMVDKKLRTYMKKKCSYIGVPCISAIAHVVQEVAKYVGVISSRNVPGWQHLELDDEYFKRVEAIKYSISHDDGQNLGDINNADVVLLGVSRASKTPTSLCLAQRGLKTANIPYIPGIGLGIDIEQIKVPLMVGLTISPDRLKVLRAHRLSIMGDKEKAGNKYTDPDLIIDELKEAKLFFQKHNIQTIDITGKAIEETAAQIINLFFEKSGKRWTED
jgi:regulator of PEP synthase PpsR (kinase-PPPase family)